MFKKIRKFAVLLFMAGAVLHLGAEEIPEILSRKWEKSTEMSQRQRLPVDVLEEQARGWSVKREGNKNYWFEIGLIREKQSDAIPMLMAIYSGYYDKNEKDPAKYEYWSNSFEELKLLLAREKLERDKEFDERANEELDEFFKRASTYAGTKTKLSRDDTHKIALCAIMMGYFHLREITIVVNPLEKKLYYINNPYYDPRKAEEINRKVSAIKIPMVYVLMYTHLRDREEFNDLAMSYLEKAAEMDFDTAKKLLKHEKKGKTAPQIEGLFV